MDFWLVEEIKSDFFEKHSSMKFPKHRIIRLILEDTEVEKNRDFIEFFDELLLSSISNTQVDRWIPCQECSENQEAGFFHAAKKFILNDDMGKCRPNSKHKKRSSSKQPKSSSEQTRSSSERTRSSSKQTMSSHVATGTICSNYSINKEVII